ncbi:MAG: tetratricopeptide repeat protein, partial [Gammaproteobacteria bacterium]|nr:tetratricopeptide repeat protein [Gammaproteobacteria bacterium]
MMKLAIRGFSGTALVMKLIRTIGMVALFLLTATPAFSQGAGIEWDILNQEVMSLYQKGQYDRAVIVAKKALGVAEKALGPDHPDVAASLNNLAYLYYTQGQYAQAEPLYKRSLAIREKALGPDHPDVATSLNNLALLYDRKSTRLNS